MNTESGNGNDRTNGVAFIIKKKISNTVLKNNAISDRG